MSGSPVPLYGGSNQTFAVSNAGTTSVAPATPGAAAIGDLLIMAVGFQNNVTATTPVATGWTHLGPNVTSTVDGRRPAAFLCKAIPDQTALTAVTGATHTVSATATNGRIAATIFRLTGADLVNPEAAQSAWKTPATDAAQTCTIPVPTVPRDGCLILGLVNVQMNSTPAPASITWSGGTEVADVPTLTSTTATHTVLGVYAESANAGTPTQRTATVSVNQVANSCGYSVAIQGTLDGTAAGAGSATGTLTPVIDGAASGTSAPTASLQPVLSGTAAGAGSATASLAAGLSGSAAGAGAASGTFQPVLGGTATGSGTATGELQQPPLDGTASGAGAASGTLIPGVAGTAAGSGSASGSLVTAITGTAAGAGNASGVLRPVMAGTASGVGAASGVLRPAVSGSAAGAGAATSTLVPVLGGSATGAGGASGTLIAPTVFTGVASGAGGASAQLVVRIDADASGLSAEVAFFHPTLRGATAAGTGSATGTFTSRLAGVAAGVGAATGQLRPVVAGTATGVGGATGELYEDFTSRPNQGVVLTSGPRSGSRTVIGPRKTVSMEITGPR